MRLFPGSVKLLVLLILYSYVVFFARRSGVSIGCSPVKLLAAAADQPRCPKELAIASRVFYNLVFLL